MLTGSFKNAERSAEFVKDMNVEKSTNERVWVLKVTGVGHQLHKEVIIEVAWIDAFDELFNDYKKGWLEKGE